MSRKGKGTILSWSYEHTPISETVVLKQMKARPVDMNVIQIYAPAMGKENEEVGDM